MALGDILRRSAERYPHAVALDFYGRRYRYAELLGLAERAAAGFARLGLGPGSRVGLFLPNTPHYPIAYYGALLAGATVVNFSPLYTSEDVVRQAQDSRTDALVCLDLARLWAPARAALEEGAVQRLIVGNLAEVLPPAKALGYRLLKRSERAPVRFDARRMRFAALVDEDGGRFVPPPVDPERDLALIQYTGGTTGTPKGAALTHANLSVNAQQLLAVDPDPQRPERLLAVLPLFHIFANSCVLNRTLLRGGELVMLPRFDPAEALAAIARRRVTDFAGVPAMFQALIDHPAFARTDLGSLQRAYSGGAAMASELKDRFEAATGVRILEGYGLTETAGVVSANPIDGAEKSGSAGQPLPGTIIRIVAPADPVRALPQGTPGEILVSGPQVMQGYWRGDTGQVEPLEGGLLRTGDIGFLDSDGFLRIVDRIKDMINVGGFKVFPSRLEAVLHSHPAVREALVLGVPDARVGERPKAFVVLHKGWAASPAELLDYLNSRVGKHERAESIAIRSSLPKTPIGKPSRAALAAEERARLAAAPQAASEVKEPLDERIADRPVAVVQALMR